MTTEVSVVNGNGRAKPVKRNAKAAPKGRGKAVKARKARVFDPAKLDRFGFRKGSIKSKAAALYASGKGATLADVREEVGSTQFNLITELEGKGFKFDRTQVPGAGARMATKYRLHASK